MDFVERDWPADLRVHFERIFRGLYYMLGVQKMGSGHRLFPIFFAFGALAEYLSGWAEKKKLIQYTIYNIQCFIWEDRRRIVLIKQVPNMVDIKLDPKTGNLIREGV